ncbi:MAG: chloride channel protein [Alphaproteobacteria bacterium]|nr:chloride channel protein [Alphaproteobacteria bacterium]
MSQHSLSSGRAIFALIQMLVFLIITGLGFGVIMAFVTNGFVIGVGQLTQMREGLSIFQLTLGNSSLSLTPLLAMLVAAVIIILIRKMFGISRWHGPGDSIYAAHRTDNELDVKAGFGSTLAAFVSASGGASVGQYGPLVHFGATIGSFVRQITGGRLTTDIFIGCGVASAIAAGFNAPIAGVVFAHEAILRHFSVRTVTPIAIASITSAGMSKWIFGDNHAFSGVPDINLVEVLPIALIAGPVFGIIAAIYMLGMRHSTQLIGRSGLTPSLLLFAAAIITGLVGMVLPQILGLGTGVVLDMLNMEFGLAMLLTILVAKVVMTALCLSMGFYGGIFSPALFIGAAAGASIQKLLASIGIMVSGPVMVVCGMAAVASAVIGAPVSGVLIMLEMTMSYDYALAAMLSVVTAALISHHIYGHSFFDRQLLDRGIDISQGRGHLEMMEIPVHDLVSDDYVTAHQSDSKSDVVTRMIAHGVSESYLLDNNVFIGKLTLHELLQQPDDIGLTDAADTDAISIKHDASLMQAIEIASTFVGESIPVINRDNGDLLGVVTEGDIFGLYLSTQNRITDLERS